MIILGKANMHELALGVTTTNFTPFAGFCQNPYDRRRIAGGSSGGTAAAIAARIVPAGLGTDTGASVRVPASFNGIAGLRPSVGNGRGQRRYSGRGVLPLSSTFDTVGPMGRTVADVALLDSVATGSAMAMRTTLRGVRLGVPPALWGGLEDEVATVAHAAREQLARAGVELVDVDIPDLFALGDRIGFPIVLHEAMVAIPRYLRESGATGITLEDIAAKISSPDVKAGFGAIVSDAYGSEYPDAVNVFRPQLQRLVASYFRSNGVDALVFPTSPVLPAPIDPVNGSGTISVDGGPPLDTFTTTIRNMTLGSAVGMPGLSLPAGMSASGLPVGLDIEGWVGRDTLVLSLGMAMESILGTVPAPQL